MTVIGIDPGKSGGIAIWNYGIVKALKCPNSIPEMASIVSSCLGSWQSDAYKKVMTDNIVAYIERVHAFPTDGRSSAFKFGQNYGQWLGILGALGIDTVFVTPQTWMKYYKDKFSIELPKEKLKRKRKLKELAIEYVNKRVTLYNSDAILIAVYGFVKQNIKEELPNAK